MSAYTLLTNEPGVRRNFVILHSIAAAAHLAGIVTTAVIADFDAEVKLYKVVYEPVASTTNVAVKVVEAGGLYVAWLCVFWFVCSFLFHVIFLVCEWTGNAGWYWSGIERCVGVWRWSEYFFSASIMLAAATTLLGTRELNTVVSATVSMATTMALGYAVELNSERYIETVSPPTQMQGFQGIQLTKRWKPDSFVGRLHLHDFGYVPYALSWWLCISSFYQAKDALVTQGGLPDDAELTLWLSFALFSLFGIVQLTLLFTTYGPSYYWVGEACYLVLSVVAKATMAFLFLFRALTPEAVARLGDTQVVLASR